jgi:hypothetical protein
LVEQLIRNQQVSGSNPLVGSSSNPANGRVFSFRLSALVEFCKEPNKRQVSAAFRRGIGRRQTVRIDVSRFFFYAVPVVAAALVAACGGGTTNYTPVATTNPNSQFTVTQTAAVSSVAAPLVLPSSGAFGGTLTLSARTVPASETLTETLTNIAPTAGPVLQSNARLAQSRSAESVVAGSQTLYVLITSSLSFVQTSPPVFALTLPSVDITAGAMYYLALYDPMQPALGWQRGFAGPATISGTTLTFAPTGTTFTFAAGVQYAFGVYTNTGATPSPVPAATATATASPTPTPIAVTASATQTYVGTNQTFVATETGYTGAFTATAACTNGANSSGTVGTITAGTATPAPTGGATFTFVPANPGTCTVSVKDASLTAGTITFTVSATNVGVN